MKRTYSLTRSAMTGSSAALVYSGDLDLKEAPGLLCLIPDMDGEMARGALKYLVVLDPRFDSYDEAFELLDKWLDKNLNASSRAVSPPPVAFSDLILKRLPGPVDPMRITDPVDMDIYILDHIIGATLRTTGAGQWRLRIKPGGGKDVIWWELPVSVSNSEDFVLGAMLKKFNDTIPRCGSRLEDAIKWLTPGHVVNLRQFAGGELSIVTVDKSLLEYSAPTPAMALCRAIVDGRRQ